MISCRRAISDTTAPCAYDSATIRPLSSSLHRRRRPTPLRISTRPRGAVASTIWSTIYANRSCQHRSHLPNYAALRKMGAKHRLHSKHVPSPTIEVGRKQRVLSLPQKVVEFLELAALRAIIPNGGDRASRDLGGTPRPEFQSGGGV